MDAMVRTKKKRTVIDVANRQWKTTETFREVYFIRISFEV